ncbi:hypothetical protein GCM10027521_12880 [Amycolatopsis cihanbeyliensis]
MPSAMLLVYLLCHLMPGAVDHVEPLAASAVPVVSDVSGMSAVSETDADCRHPAPDPVPPHDADHPRCVAVPRSSDGAAAVPLLLFLLPGTIPAGRLGGACGPPGPRRGPPPVSRGGRDVLTALCVLRN